MAEQALQDLMSLTGKNAIVTGAGVGIGAGIATRLAQAGASVMVADISKERAHRTAEELTNRGYSAQAIECDVSNETSVDTMVTATVQQYGSVEILVNNAGIFPAVSVLQMSPHDFDHVIDINLRGTFLCTKSVANAMIEHGCGGKIINITSIDALHPSTPGLAHYDASKHGMWGFIKNVALELAPHNIWVNAIAPGGIATPGLAQAQTRTPQASDVNMQEMVEEFVRGIPMHRLGEPDDVAKVALFLASDMSSYITGSQIVVDGGALLG